MKKCFFKRLILIAFVIGMTFHANAQSTNVTLSVTLNDGSEQTYQLTEKSQLYFDNGETLVIEDGDGTTMSFALSAIRKITCSEYTGILEGGTLLPQVLPNPTRNHFVIRNLTETCNARIYALDGRMVMEFQATEGMTVDLSALSQGMYLLHINGQTQKLMKL